MTTESTTKMLEEKDRRIAELEAECERRARVGEQIEGVHDILRKERDQALALVREMRDELVVHDCTKGLSACRICMRVEKANQLLGDKE